MSTRRLLLDAGNTRLKWAVVDGVTWLARGSAAYDALPALDASLLQGATCHVASVAGPARDALLGAWLAEQAVSPAWLAVSPRACGVENAYEVSQLGVDRWMALLAARARTESAVLVVSVGTAATVDALLPSGRFIGGIIVPGLRLMRQSLEQGAARLAPDICTPDTAAAAGASGRVVAFPESTVDAVQTGLVAALCGAVQIQYARLAAVTDAPPRCYVTGGDAVCILPHLAVPAEPIADLVLEGVERVTRRKEST